MRRLSLIVFACVSAVGLSACGTTNRAVVSNAADLDGYRYAVLSDATASDRSLPLMDIEDYLHNAFTDTRLKVVNREHAHLLSDAEKQQLLAVSFSRSHNVDETVVNIVFADYVTGTHVASCCGVHEKDWTRQMEMRAATKNALEQIKKLF